MHYLKVVSLCLVLPALGACSKEEPAKVAASEEVHVGQAPATSQIRSGGAPALPPNSENSKVRRLGGRAFVFDEFPTAPEGAPEDVIRSLEARALAGDADASYAIYLKINECAAVTSRDIQGLPVRGSPSGAMACRELSADEAAKISDWLVLAADQGSISAQLLYASNPEAILGDPSEILRDPDKAKAYKSKAIGFLESAASRGSVDALLRLGNAYDVGVLVGRDPIRSKAYFEAVRQIDPALVPAKQVAALERSMRTEQLTSSLEQGRKIYGDCCR